MRHSAGAWSGKTSEVPVRLRTLIRTSYEFKNAMMNVPTVARAASALRNFSIW